MADSMDSQSKTMEQPAEYAYLFRAGLGDVTWSSPAGPGLQETGLQRLLFVRNYGSGVTSVAQLVHDCNSNTNLIRKVGVHSLRLGWHASTEEAQRLEAPREIQVLRTIQTTFNPAEPGLPCYITELYGHEYIRSNHPDHDGRPRYHSVSYWKLYNGRSVYTRWLSGQVNPPVVACARMVRQVLSTLHYLYTAGPEPIFNGDSHFGNIWAHWTAEEPLPDFYLGDFSEATLAEHRRPYLETGEPGWAGRPIDDLHNFWHGLAVLVDMLGSRRGHGDPGVKALRRLSDGISDAIHQWKLKSFASDRPPDLIPLINWAKDLEQEFGKGGIADETQSECYVKYTTEEKRIALQVEKERPFVVQGTKADALRPRRFHPDREPTPVAIHGPWSLVHADRNWAPAEADGVVHHRPNRDGVKLHDGEEDLSTTNPEPEQGPWLGELYSSVDERRKKSSASYTSSVDSSGKLTPQPSSSSSGGDDPAPVATPSSTDNASGKEESEQGKDGKKKQADSPNSEDEPFNGEQHYDRRRAGRARIATSDGRWTSFLHRLLHGPDCRCPQEVWRADVEAVLRRERLERQQRAALRASSLEVNDPVEQLKDMDVPPAWQ